MTDQATEQDLTPQQVAELTNAQLVDVRTHQEFDTSRIAGARHVPLDRLQQAAAELDPSRPVVFYCRVGERSAMASAAFRASGWEAYTMSGGLVEWAADGKPLEPEGADVAQHSSIPSP